MPYSHRSFVFSEFEIKSQVDVIILKQRKRQDFVTAARSNIVQNLLQAPTIWRSDHEPEVQYVLALVIVIDLRVRAHQRRDRLQFGGWHGHGGQSVHPQGVPALHGTDARPRAPPLETPLL